MRDHGKFYGWAYKKMNDRLTKKASEKENIIFVLPSLSGGGAERVISLLASKLVQMGYSVHLILYYKDEKEYEIDPRVSVFYVESSFMENRTLMHKVRKFMRVRNKIRSIGSAYIIPVLPGCVIHTFWAVQGIPYVKFIATIRNNPEHISPDLRKKNDWCICHADALWTQNKTQSDYYKKLGTKKIFVLENPVNPLALQQKHYFSKELFHFVAVGRLSNQKNYPLMLQAFYRVHQKYPMTTLNIYGEGSAREQIEQTIRDYSLEESVLLHGWTDNVLEKINREDIYLLSSDYEGMPNSLMEAMAEGLPCLSTDCPTGPAPLLREGRGVLVPCNDADAMAERMIWMIRHSQEVKKMGEKSRKYMEEHYSLDYISRELVRSCERVCNCK